MTILFTQYWDVNPGDYDDYSKFIAEEFNPELENLGIRVEVPYLVMGIMKGL